MFDDVEGMLLEESLQSTGVGVDAITTPAIADERFEERGVAIGRSRRDIMRLLK